MQYLDFYVFSHKGYEIQHYKLYNYTPGVMIYNFLDLKLFIWARPSSDRDSAQVSDFLNYRVSARLDSTRFGPGTRFQLRIELIVFKVPARLGCSVQPVYLVFYRQIYMYNMLSHQVAARLGPGTRSRSDTNLVTEWRLEPACLLGSERLLVYSTYSYKAK